MRIFISAGEVSSDVAGARLVRQLLRDCPSASITGIGGSRMAEAGATIACQTDPLGAVGITEGLAVLPPLVRAFRLTRRHVRAERPDVAVFIGNDFYNAASARWFKARAVPTVAYFPPQAWIWRSLARPIARGFDLILTSFPHEQAIYAHASSGARVRFVGHYLAEALQPRSGGERDEARQALGLPVDHRVVTLMPGSRADEIHRLTPAFVGAAARLHRRDGALTFVVALADSKYAPALEAAVEAHGLAAHTTIVTDSHVAMRASDLLLVASGTATLEATLLGVPMVIGYRVSPVTHAVVRACLRLGLIESYVVGLPNLILERPAVPELLQAALTADAFADQAWALLTDRALYATTCASLSDAAARMKASGVLEEVSSQILELAQRGRTAGSVGEVGDIRQAAGAAGRARAAGRK